MTSSYPVPKQFAEDMAKLASVAEAFTDPTGQAVVTDLVAAMSQCLQFGLSIDDLSREADQLLAAGGKDQARLGAIKKELQTLLQKLSDVQTVVVPDLVHRLQELAPSEEVAAQLKSITDTTNKRPTGIQVDGEANNDKGPGGSDLWSD